jgi:hypothetical protein
LGQCFIDDVPGHVMEKVNQRIDCGVRWTAITQVLLPLGLGMASMAPPVARHFSRLRDHRIHQDEQRHWSLLADEGCGEAGQRLHQQDEASASALADCPNDGIGVFAKFRRVIGRRE